MSKNYTYKGVRIYTENDNVVDFEKNSWKRKTLSRFFTFVLNLIPSKTVVLIKKSHTSAETVIKNKTSHKALETLYSSGLPQEGRKESFFKKITRTIWFNLDNSKSVRNRLKLVKYLMEECIRKVENENSNRDKDVSILSIASGSARSVLESLPEADDVVTRYHITLLDKNPEALVYSKDLVTKLKKQGRFRWIEDTVSKAPNYFEDWPKPDIIEIVGLLDYFDDNKVLETFKMIHELLEPGGYMIAGNIDNNRERKFVTKVIGWEMVYRNAERMIDIATSAGFSSEKIEAYYEPLKIHSIIVASK